MDGTELQKTYVKIITIIIKFQLVQKEAERQLRGLDMSPHLHHLLKVVVDQQKSEIWINIQPMMNTWQAMMIPEEGKDIT